MRILFVTLSLFAASRAHADALMLDGNGASIGLYTGILENQGSVVISSTGYRYVVERESGRTHGPVDTSHEVLYSGNTFCTGQLYFETGASGHFAGAGQFRGVLVPIISGQNGLDLVALYYVPQIVTAVSITLYGKFLGGPVSGTTCTAITPRDSVVLPASLNDPAVTGVPNSYFVPPLKVSRNDIFYNGFEAPPLGAVDSAHGQTWQTAMA